MNGLVNRSQFTHRICFRFFLIDAQAVNMKIALAVVKAAIDEGVSDLKVPEEDLRSYLVERTWKAEYAEYKYDPEGVAF